MSVSGRYSAWRPRLPAYETRILPPQPGGILPCAAANPIDSASVPLTNPTFCKSLGARTCRGSKCNALESSWRARRATGPGLWPSNSNAIKPRFGGPAIGIKPKASSACSPTAGRNTRGDTPRFPPLQRAQIVELACLEPLAKGLHITHWSSEYVSTGHRLVTWAQETPCSEVAKGQDGGRFQTCFSEASTHQTVNREKREETCPSRVVAGEFAERDETCFGKRLRVPEIFVEGVRILGLRANEEVTRLSERLVRGSGTVRPQDDETGKIEAGRGACFEST